MGNNRTLVLTFSDDAGNKRTLTINKPSSSIDASGVSAQMDALIASGILIVENSTGTKVPVTTKVGAKFVTQTKTAVTI